MSVSDLQAIILAAGKGTRMYSTLPKVLHTICGRSLLWKALATVAHYKPRKIVVVVGYGEELVRAEVERFAKSLTDPIKIECVTQSEQRGTGHAVQTALSALDPSPGNILILPGDLPLLTGGTLLPLFSAETPPAKLHILSCDVPDPTGFGRIVREEDGTVLAIVEEKDCSEEERDISEINSGIYLLERELLNESIQSLQPNNAQKELYLTDIVEFSVDAEQPVEAVIAPDCYPLLGANTRLELASLERMRRDEMVSEYMLAGVSFEDPSAVYIDEGILIGRDCFIGAGTRLLGATTIGSGVIIDGQSRILNSTIGASCYIKLNCVITSSSLGEDCSVGPFAHLRPGSRLERRVHIGNFVETKKTELGEGAKANHLTYLGDSVIGANANVGAGTITCNYDGFNKHLTEIGEGAFIGSNSSLVAPVKIGARAIVGAGSVITKDVAEDALAVERSEVRTLPEWAKNFRARHKKSVS